MNGKSIIALLLTVLLVLAGVYYLTNKGKNFSLIPKKTNSPIPKQVNNDIQVSSENMKGRKQVIIPMVGNKFNPATITIDAGTVVTWRNDDTVSHFINTDSNTLPALFAAQNSSEIKPNETYSIKFDVPDQYSYHCNTHISQGMTGQIKVE